MLTDLKTVLNVAKKKNCAIPAFNVYNQETVLGALQAAEEANSCVILQMYSRLFTSIEAEFLAPSLIAAAQRSKVKVCFHLDHGASDEAVYRALRWGCTGIMRDASSLPIEENIAITKHVAEVCHDLGVHVEGELGHIGMAKEGVSTEYTKVDEAVRFVKETGVDALAILVGTAHGHYKQAPVLAIDRIAEINKAVDAALVLHGGSGVPDDQIVAAVKAGIRKINFGTDVCCALLDGIFAEKHEAAAIDVFMKRPTASVKAFCLSKIDLLGAEGTNE
ncbi:MAG: class II fructose-bisphosphate aldolase [Eubacteriales bacterium]|nr:class II fructose-bisphosphate aldolase [Eubacteriales bacterium]